MVKYCDAINYFRLENTVAHLAIVTTQFHTLTKPGGRPNL